MSSANKLRNLAKLLNYNRPLFHWTEREYVPSILEHGLTTNPNINKHVGENSFRDRSGNLSYGKYNTKLGEFKKKPLYFITNDKDYPPVYLHEPVALQIDLPDNFASTVPAGVHTVDQTLPYNIEKFFPDISNLSDEEAAEVLNLPWLNRETRRDMTTIGREDRKRMFNPDNLEILLFDDISKDWISDVEIPENVMKEYLELTRDK